MLSSRPASTLLRVDLSTNDENSSTHGNCFSSSRNTTSNNDENAFGIASQTSKKYSALTPSASSNRSSKKKKIGQKTPLSSRRRALGDISNRNKQTQGEFTGNGGKQRGGFGMGLSKPKTAKSLNKRVSFVNSNGGVSLGHPKQQQNKIEKKKSLSNSKNRSMSKRASNTREKSVSSLAMTSETPTKQKKNLLYEDVELPAGRLYGCKEDMSGPISFDLDDCFYEDSSYQVWDRSSAEAALIKKLDNMAQGDMNVLMGDVNDLLDAFEGDEFIDDAAFISRGKGLRMEDDISI